MAKPTTSKTTKHTWRLAARKSHQLMVIYCHQLRLAKAFKQPEGYFADNNLARALVESYTKDYYANTLRPGMEPDKMEVHMRYLNMAKIRLTYEVEL